MRPGEKRAGHTVLTYSTVQYVRYTTYRADHYAEDEPSLEPDADARRRRVARERRERQQRAEQRRRPARLEQLRLPTYSYSSSRVYCSTSTGST